MTAENQVSKLCNDTLGKWMKILMSVLYLQDQEILDEKDGGQKIGHTSVHQVSKIHTMTWKETDTSVENTLEKLLYINLLEFHLL